MNITILDNRDVIINSSDNLGTQNENNASIINFSFPESLMNANKKIVFITDDGNYWDLITNNSYKITNAVSKYKNVSVYVWLVDEQNDIDFRSKIWNVSFNKNEEPDDIVPTEEEISGFDTMITQLNQGLEELDEEKIKLRREYEKVEEGLEDLDEALIQVNNVDIDVSKSQTTTTVTITNKEGTEKSVQIEDGTDYVITPEDYQTIANVVETDITPLIPTKTSDLDNDSGFIDNTVNNLTNYYDKTTSDGKYALITETGYRVELSVDSSTYVMTLNLKNKSGNILNTQTVDLPLETMVVNASYDSLTKEIVLTLQNGNTIRFSVADLVSGLQTEITSNNKLASDLVDDTNQTNKFVTTTEKTTWNAKYDKPSGGIPSTDLSSAVQTSLDKADTAVQDVSGKEDKSNKVTSIDENSTDTQYPSAKLLYDKINGLDTRVENLENTSGYVYGVRRKIANNTSPEWERLWNSVGKVANATKNGGTVVNDLDNLSPWKDIISFNLDLTTGKKTAYYGDADFKFDGTNGDVYTHIPTFWLKIWQDDGYMYISIADYNKTGYTEIKEFDIARYLTGIGNDNKLHSYSGINGAAFKSIVTFRELAQALGDDYCLLDWRYFAIQCLYLVEYATFNSQSALGNGYAQMRHTNTDVALVAGTNTQYVVVNSTAGDAFVVGQQVCIGTLENASAVTRTITAKTAYSSGGITGTQLTLDQAVSSITTSTAIWTGVQNAGQCDSLGMKSGCLANDNKHQVIYRGIEGILGNIYQWVDGINIKDNVSWVCYDPSEYASNKFEAPYEELGYTNLTSINWPKTLGFDINHPLIQFPTESGGSSSTGTTDYYFQNTGNRVARVGGYLRDGANGGLWYWYLGDDSSRAVWSCGARVLKYKTKSQTDTLLNVKVDKSSFAYDSNTETLTITIS